jgi:hypothetical protein
LPGIWQAEMSFQDVPIQLDLISSMQGHPERSRGTAWRYRAAITGIILMAALIGCGRQRQDVVGKWRAGSDSSAMVWEFANDGSVQMGSIRGRYSFGDGDRLKIETSSGISVYQMELAGDQMTLKDPSGSQLKFTKLK